MSSKTSGLETKRRFYSVAICRRVGGTREAGLCEKCAGVLGAGDNGAGNRRINENFKLGCKAARLSLNDSSGGERIESTGLGSHQNCETKVSQVYEEQQDQAN